MVEVLRQRLSREDAKERRIRAVYQGEIEGKRSGMKQNISRAARRRWVMQQLDEAKRGAERKRLAA